MTRQDELALRTKRCATLKSIKAKKRSRVKQIRETAEAEIREVNILYAKNPERLRAKYASAEYARSERARIRAEKKIANENKIIEKNIKVRQFSLAEEIFTAIVQGIGAGLAIAATVLLTVQAAGHSPLSLRANFITSYACVGASLIIMYIMSCLHHALTPVGAKEVFNKLARAFALVAIGSGYTAMLVTALHGTLGWVLFGIVWGVIIFTIVMYSIFANRYDRLMVAMHLLLGWAGIFMFARLISVLPPISLRLLLTTGIIYTISIPFYVSRKIKFMHSIGSIIMLVASVTLYLSLLFQLHF